MKTNPRELFKRLLKLAVVSMPDQLQTGNLEPKWRYQRLPKGGWQGSLEYHPHPFTIVARNFQQKPEWIEEITAMFEADYSKYLKTVWVGNSGAPLQPNTVLSSLIVRCFERFGTYKPNDVELDSVVDDAINSLDSTHVSIRLMGPIAGLDGPVDFQGIFLGDVKLRPITDEEVSWLYGNMLNPYTGHPTRFPTYVLVKDVSLRKRFENDAPFTETENIYRKAIEDFDNAILVINSVKEFRPIGYDGIYSSPLGFSFNFSALSRTRIPEQVIISHNTVTRDELSQLEAHASIFKSLDHHLEIACHRLVDANRRTRYDEAIVDAVIGLESILLFGTAQELAYRFALNYSILEFVDDRATAFTFAKTLYRLRSSLVHGAQINRDSKFGAEQLSIAEVAIRARGALRQTICLFARASIQSEFSKDGYWEKRQLELPHKATIRLLGASP